MSLKAKIEAILFLTDKPLPATAIAVMVNEDIQIVRQTLLELIHDYEERNGALEIADDSGYMMQAKDEYSNFANDMAPVELSVSVVRTLSAIAIKQPVLQSEIVRIRGAGAYDHIKELEERELITKKEEGRSALLSTTKKFQEYFRLSQDARSLRNQLKEQAEEQGLENMEPPTAEQEIEQLKIDQLIEQSGQTALEQVTTEQPTAEQPVEELSATETSVAEQPGPEALSENNTESFAVEENTFAGPSTTELIA